MPTGNPTCSSDVAVLDQRRVERDHDGRARIERSRLSVAGHVGGNRLPSPHDGNVHHREWLAAKEVAHELRVNVAAIYRAVQSGRLPAVRLSRTGPIRIHRSALDPKEGP